MMTTVTVVELRDNLPELLRRAAAGEYIAITEDGKWIAALTIAPKMLPFVEDEAKRRAGAEELERQIAKWHEEDGLPYPPQGELPTVPQRESPAA
jgi:antitoxin (DNA-binding transcriptional repressor) of toxin-antitoxin stability system